MGSIAQLKPGLDASTLVKSCDASNIFYFEMSKDNTILPVCVCVFKSFRKALTIKPKVDLYSYSSCLTISNAGVTDARHHVQLRHF
jgi:hypothetical protein